MKIIFLGCLLSGFLLSACNKGVYVSIDNKKYNYGKNTVVTFRDLKGTPPGYMFYIQSFNESVDDSSSFVFGVSRANDPITAGNYSFPGNNRNNFPTSTITFYNSHGNKYVSGGDEIYGSSFMITSLNKKRAKGWFKGKLVDIKADTAKPTNAITVVGRFNVSLSKSQHY